jgi:hypothetical protein
MRSSFLVIALSFFTYSFAQTRIAVVGGLNLPWQHYKFTTPSGSGNVNYDMVASFHAGMVADFTVSERISFQPGLQVSGRGGQLTSHAFNTTGKREIRLYYLEMPLVVNYNIPVGENKVFFGAGPSLAYGLSGKDKQTTYATFTYDAFENLFNKFDAGLIAQAGYRMKNIQVAAKYNSGFLNIYNNDNPNLPQEQSADCRNNVLAFSVAYFFSLKK